MSWEGIVAIATCLGLIITIATFVFALGKLVSRFEILEGRVVEDREKNSTQHAEFYVNFNTSAITTTLLTPISCKIRNYILTGAAIIQAIYFATNVHSTITGGVMTARRLF